MPKTSQNFRNILSFLPAILLFMVGIFFIWAWEGIEDTIYAVMAFVMGAYYLYRTIKRKKASKQPVQSVSKIKRAVEKAIPKGGKEKAESKKGAKKFIIIGIVVVVVIIILAIFLNGSKKGIEFEGEAEWTFDFPVSSLRNGDVTLVRQEEYFADSSAKYTVVGNTSDETQEDIDIFEYLPLSMAQGLDDIEYNLEAEVISQEDPVVLKFTIDELEPQKSVVIKIASEKGVSDAEEGCVDDAVSDCEEHFQEIAQDAEKQGRAQYQSAVEPVTSVDAGEAGEEQDFLTQVLDESKNLISAARDGSAQGSESGDSWVGKIKEFFAEVSEAIQTYQTGETKEERSWGNLPAPETTALDQDWFPQEITKTWVFNKAQEVEISTNLCGAAPLKTMLAGYAIPEQYRGNLSALQQTSQVIEISVYPTVKDARMAAQYCGDALLRRDSGIPHALYWINLSMDYTTYSAGMPNRAIAAIDNYVVSMKLKTGPGGWNELMIRDTVFPAFISQIRSQY